MNLALSRHDCYLAVAGGLSVDEPAADLGIAADIVSSYKNMQLSKNIILIGEIGLGGQVRPVKQISQRIQEANRLGFKIAVIPKNVNSEKLNSKNSIKLIEISNINEAINEALSIDSKKVS